MNDFRGTHRPELLADPRDAVKLIAFLLRLEANREADNAN